MLVQARNAVVLVVLAVFAACAGAQKTSSSEAVTTLAEGRHDYQAGLRALADGDFPTASDLFQKVSRGPSYIVYSPLARLRLGDVLYYQDKFEEAAETYRAFIETSQGDPNLHYAYFMLAQSRVKSIPADFLLVPPADRRDPRRIRGSLSSLDEFLGRFPDSPYVDEGLAMLTKLLGTVVSYEMDVARFYSTRNKPAGTIARIRRLMLEVPRAASREDVRFALLDALAKTDALPDLRKECAVYQERFPAGRNRSRVEELCRKAEAHADAR